jgi:hypothetical protein
MRLYGEEDEGEDCWTGLTVMRLHGEDGKGEGEDWGLTVMRLYKEEGEGEDCWTGLTVMRLHGEDGKGEGEDWGLTVMRLYKEEGEGEDCWTGLTVMRLHGEDGEGEGEDGGRTVMILYLYREEDGGEGEVWRLAVRRDSAGRLRTSWRANREKTGRRMRGRQWERVLITPLQTSVGKRRNWLRELWEQRLTLEKRGCQRGTET